MTSLSGYWENYEITIPEKDHIIAKGGRTGHRQIGDMTIPEEGRWHSEKNDCIAITEQTGHFHRKITTLP